MGTRRRLHPGGIGTVRAGAVVGAIVALAVSCGGGGLTAQNVREEYGPQVAEVRRALDEIASALQERPGQGPSCPAPIEGSERLRVNPGNLEVTNAMVIMEESLSDPAWRTTDEDTFDLEVGDLFIEAMNDFDRVGQAMSDEQVAEAEPWLVDDDGWFLEELTETLDALERLDWVVVVRVIDYVPPVITHPTPGSTWWEGSVAFELAVMEFESRSLRCVFQGAAEAPPIVTFDPETGKGSAVYEGLADEARDNAQQMLDQNDQCCGEVDLAFPRNGRRPE
jgi:hypothetical protein